MKQKLLTLLLALAFVFTNASAQVITAEQAKTIANSLFSVGMQKSAARNVASQAQTTTHDSNTILGENADEAPTFYIVSNPDGGFVVVSGEQIDNPVIGYSFEGEFTADSELPVGFVDYLNGVSEQVRILREQKASQPQKTSARGVDAPNSEYDFSVMGEKKVELNTAPWGQREPFNKLCPSGAITGCVPTAFAILCKYHRWPEAGTGTVVHKLLTENNSIELGHTYYYDNMRDDNYSTYTTEQADAVATLMRDLGYAYSVEWGTAGTTATESAIPLMNHFGYTNPTPDPKALQGTNRVSKRDLTDNDDIWKGYIKGSLDDNCPIPYSAAAYSYDEKDDVWKSNGRHIFILDGYTDNDYFHFNWGWYGDLNGWFTLDNMVLGDNSKYTTEHRAFFNLKPNRTTYNVTALVADASMGTVSINNGTASNSVSANCYEGATPTLRAYANSGYRFSEWRKDGVKVSDASVYKPTVVASNSENEYVAYFVEYSGPVYTETQYKVTNSSMTPSNYQENGASWCSTLTYKEDPSFTLSTSLNGNKAYALYKTADYFYASAFTENNKANFQTGITYTLTAPEGCYITKYSFDCKSSYDVTITYANGTTKSLSDEYQGISEEGLFVESVSFTMTTTETSKRAKVDYQNFTVTIASDNGGNETGGDETKQYTIKVASNLGTAGYAHIGDAINTQKTVNEGEQVTLTAVVSDNAYEFKHWECGTTTITENPYTVTATADATYTAVFEKKSVTPEPEQPATGSGYYYIVNRDTNRHGYIYNNALLDGNTNRWTLQSNSAVTNNNGIWYITFKDENKLGVKNGDGNPIVAGNNGNSIFAELNIGETYNDNGVTYYYFTQALNCSKDLYISDCLHLTTWEGHPEAPDNQWRLEAVDMAGKSVYEVEAGEGVYVTYTNGTTTEYAYNGGFFITNDAIDATKLAVVGGDNLEAVVEGNTIKVVTTSYTITYKVDDAVYQTAAVTIGAALPTVAAPEKEGHTFTGWKIATVKSYDKEPINIKDNADNMLYCNAPSKQNNGDKFTSWDVLFDKNRNTYLHTSYEGTAESEDGKDHYLRVDLGAGNEIKDFVFNYETRNNATDDYPTKIVIEGSNNNVDYNEITRIESGLPHKDDAYESGVISSGTAYRYIRFVVIETSTTRNDKVHPFWHISEFGMSEVVPVYEYQDAPAVMPEGDLTLVATYTPNVLYTISASANPGTAGNVTGAGEYAQGATVTLTATATDKAYHFVNWTKDGNEVSTAAEYTFTASDNAAYVANFAKNKYNVTVNTNPATAGCTVTGAGEYEHGTQATLTATAAEGYRFVNWTKGNEVVGTDATLTVTVTAAAEYVANFIPVVKVVLTDADENTYNVEVACETMSAEAITTALMAEYPYITLVGTAAYNATENKYTNTVKLPFKVSNNREAEKEYWYNIYWPVNTTTLPNYLAALSATATVVEKVNDSQYAYGDNPTYNTLNGNDKISWAVYSVNNTLAFTFKNKVTGQYIKVTSVAPDNDDRQQNAVFAAEKEATAFTLVKPTGTRKGEYALAATVGGTVGYLCSTSSDCGHAVHFNHNNHEGAWLKFTDTEVDYITPINNLNLGLDHWFGEGDGRCIANEEIQAIMTALSLENQGNVTYNTLVAYGLQIEAYRNACKEIAATAGEGGSVTINGEQVSSKKAPVNYAITLTATAAEGYEFEGWYNGETKIEGATAEYTFTVTEAVNYTAKFSKIEEPETPTNYHTVNVVVSAGTETVVNGTDVLAFIYREDGLTDMTQFNFEEGATVKLCAEYNHNGGKYVFDGWYKDGVEVSMDREITFTATEQATYEARYVIGMLVSVRGTNCNADVYDENGIECLGTGFGRVKAGKYVTLVATHYQETYFTKENGYVFAGWADADGNIISKDMSYKVQVFSDVKYYAKVEQAHYNLTVTTDENKGTVTATSGTNEAVDGVVEVGYGMSATITAEHKEGFLFSHWEKNGAVVSESETYTIKAINDVDAMADVEYVAVFVEAGSLKPGYYRIAYEFPVEQAAALTAATRAATGRVEYVIPSSGALEDPESNGYSNCWKSTDGVLTLTATCGAGVMKINYNDLSQLRVGAFVNDVYYPTKYTLSVKEGYKIIGYEIKCYPSVDNRVTCVYESGDELYLQYNANDYWIKTNDLDVESTYFELASSAKKVTTVKVLNDIFKVYIKEASETPETPETPTVETKKLYVQGVACENKVPKNPNALLMNEEKGAASIFYFDGNSLLSYSKGLYVKEDGSTARGLLAAGEKNENVVITASTEEGKYTIKAPNYLHANINVGTSTTYFVDHCGTEETAICPDESRHQFIIESVDSLPVTISSAGYATFYAPVALEVPAGLEAYYLAEGGLNADYASMTKIEGAAATDPVVVPANTGIIFTGNNGGTAAADNYNLAITTTGNEIKSLLGGTVATEYVLGGDDAGNRAYYLAMPKVDDVQWPIGFYKAKLNTDNKFLNNGHKSYLPMDVVYGDLQNSYGFRFLFGTTGIDGVASEETPEGIYDLQGRKLEGIPGAGIYIVNGKKVLVK